MIESSQLQPGDVAFSNKLAIEEAVRRGWKAWIYYRGCPLVRYERADGKTLEVYSATPPTGSYVQAMLSNDKYATQMALAEAGLPVPRTQVVGPQDASDQFADFLATYAPLVVKPLDASHGNGVTTDINDEATLTQAITVARTFSRVVLVQQQVPAAVDLRLLCIDYKFVGALRRIPARVHGDGVHTVAELIDQENARPERGERYAKLLNIIPKAAAAQYLGERMQEIPAKGAEVMVVGTANVGTGGETQDVTDELPSWLIAYAEQAARELRLPVCGVDFLLEALPTPASTEAEVKPVIIELNNCPSLFIHDKPTIGKSREAVPRYIDYLEALPL